MPPPMVEIGTDSLYETPVVPAAPKVPVISAGVPRPKIKKDGDKGE
jgi:hypothetical protein